MPDHGGRSRRATALTATDRSRYRAGLAPGLDDAAVRGSLATRRSWPTALDLRSTGTLEHHGFSGRGVPAPRALANAARRRTARAGRRGSDARAAQAGQPAGSWPTVTAPRRSCRWPVRRARSTVGTALASILGTAHVAADFVDHYRMAGSEFDYALEERWMRDEGLAAVTCRARLPRRSHSAGVAAAQVEPLRHAGPRRAISSASRRPRAACRA